MLGETIDGELLIVNLDTGAYFSARGTGSVIWDQLGGGRTASEIASAVAASYEGGADAIASSVHAFLDLLHAEGLIVEGAGQGQSAPPSVSATGPFQPPLLEKFTDMQELLLLDPVHEVEETGWPHARATAAAE